MSHYAKFVTFQALPGKGAELMAVLAASKQLGDNAPGHQQLVLGTDEISKDTIYVFDVWESREQHNAFQGKAQQIALVGQAIPLLRAEPRREEMQI